jgi:signal peptidase
MVHEARLDEGINNRTGVGTLVPVADKAKKILVSLRSYLLALAIVLAVIGGLWLYSGVWPPLVVVESASMQHSDTRSDIGVIDTGDLVILKKEVSLMNVQSYLESVPSGYSTYGELGDVVIYRPLGSYSVTPIIHRALCEVEYNSTGGGFDVPALAHVPDGMWDVLGGERSHYNIKGTLVLHDIGYDRVDVSIHFSSFLSSGRPLHDGLITLGDNNHGNIDQNSLCLEPVKAEWLEGVARGELPWFGLIKFYVSGQASHMSIPRNSESNLLISLGLIIGVPIAIDATGIILESKGIDAWAWLRRKLHLPPKKGKKAPDTGASTEEGGESLPTVATSEKGGDGKRPT